MIGNINRFADQLETKIDMSAKTEYDAGKVYVNDGEFIIDWETAGASETFFNRSTRI